MAAYGFTGTLPQLALDRLKGKPIWVFHSADDVIFPVACSDRLVESLRKVNDETEGGNLIRYSRFDSCPNQIIFISLLMVSLKGDFLTCHGSSIMNCLALMLTH